MSQLLAGKKVAFLVATEGVEQIELTDPWDALVAEHAQPSIVSTKSGTIQAFNHLDKAGELIRISQPVATELEITELADREMKSNGGGKALLIEKPTVNGAVSPFPVAINTMGSWKRMAMSLGAESVEAVAAELGADFIAVSFCRTAQDMHDARAIARAAGSDAAMVSKIERAEAIENLVEIVEASDVVMVARGDLGVEIGDAELPGLQKKIIRESLAQNRVVITATQMLQSMVESPIPTRAEVLDVANAVIDGTDAVMLSAESAAGRYPVRSVEALVRICLGAERQFAHDTDFEKAPRNLDRADQAIAMAAMFLSEHIGVRAIVAMTESGGTARFLSRFRSPSLVFALSRHDGARRRMALMRGVMPIAFDSRGMASRDAARSTIQLLFNEGMLAADDKVIFTSGDTMEQRGATNTMRLLQVGAGGRADGLGEI